MKKQKTGMVDGGNLFPLGAIKNKALPMMAPLAAQAVGKSPLPKIATPPTTSGKKDGRAYSGKRGSSSYEA